MARQSAQLNSTIARKVVVFKTILEKANIAADTIVFGSWAKGNPKKYSDIDVAVISPQFGKDYHHEMVRLMHLCTDDIIEIEPHPFHPDDLNDRWNSLSQEIKKHGIQV